VGAPTARTESTAPDLAPGCEARRLAATCNALAVEVAGIWGHVSDPARSARRLARSARRLADEETTG